VEIRNIKTYPLESDGFHIGIQDDFYFHGLLIKG